MVQAGEVEQAASIIQGGSVCALFTVAAYRVKYLKAIPKEMNQDTSTFYT